MKDTERQLLDRLLEGDLPLEVQDPVLQRLETDREAVAYLADRAILLSDLRKSLKRRRLQCTAEAAVLESARKTLQDTVIPLSCRRLAPLTWVAAVAILVAVLGGLVPYKQSNDGGAVTVEIVESQGAMPGSHWQVGSRVALRRMMLVSGRVGLRLPNDVTLDLVGPLRAEFVSASALRLLYGKATADVGEKGKGFVIETVNARVKDIGTRFGVVVGVSNETDIVVFEGKVEVFDPARKSRAQRPKITLTEGEAVRLDDSRIPQRVKMITLDSDARSLAGGASSDIVAGVRDNILASDFRRYYGLLRGGMGEGARLYTTGHTRTWHAMPGESFPQELLGADVVCTFSVDRQETDLEITVTVNRPCELYVLPDARTLLPEWLHQDFIDTGLRLRSGPWTPRGVMPDPQAKELDGTAFIQHAVWKKLILNPGPVVLGAPCPANQTGSRVMYGITVKALPPS